MSLGGSLSLSAHIQLVDILSRADLWPDSRIYDRRWHSALCIPRCCSASRRSTVCWKRHGRRRCSSCPTAGRCSPPTGASCFAGPACGWASTGPRKAPLRTGLRGMGGQPVQMQDAEQQRPLRPRGTETTHDERVLLLLCQSVSLSSARMLISCSTGPTADKP